MKKWKLGLIALAAALALHGDAEARHHHARRAVHLSRHCAGCTASQYGGGERLNAHTANGERFNWHALTAASMSLRIGTRVHVTNLNNGRSVTVRINDRGPARWTHRCIDLTTAAAHRIGLGGLAPVSLRVVS